MTIVCKLTLHWVFLQLFTIPPLTAAFDIWNEPGSLAAQRHVVAGVYTEKRFMIDGWNIHALSAAIPVGSGVAGLQVLQEGVSPYVQTHFNLMYGLRLGKSLRMAAGLGYGKGRPEATVGSVWETGKHCRLGLQFRMGGAGLGYGGASLTFQLGQPAELELAGGKEARQPLTGRLQLRYRPVDRFLLLGGYAVGPLFPYFGAGWGMGKWDIGVMGRWHPYLGISPAIMVGWKDRKSDKQNRQVE